MEPKDYMLSSNYWISVDTVYRAYGDYTQYTITKRNNDVYANYGLEDYLTGHAFDALVRKGMGLTNKEIHLR
jgi:hypothetical protein